MNNEHVIINKDIKPRLTTTAAYAIDRGVTREFMCKMDATLALVAFFWDVEVRFVFRDGPSTVSNSSKSSEEEGEVNMAQ